MSVKQKIKFKKEPVVLKKHTSWKEHNAWLDEFRSPIVYPNNEQRPTGSIDQRTKKKKRKYVYQEEQDKYNRAIEKSKLTK